MGKKPHTCTPPTEKPIQGGISPNLWRCPTCQQRFVWATRYIAGKRHEGWIAPPPNFEDRQLAMRAEYKRDVRRMMTIAIPLVVLVMAAVAIFAVWVVTRVT